MQMKIEGNHEIKMEAKCHKPFLKPVNSKKISSRNNFSNSDSDERVREDVLDSSSKLSHHSKLFVFDRGIRGGWACRRRSMAFSSPPLLSPPHSPPPEEETTPRRACGTRRVASSATTAPSVPQRRADDPPTPASEFDPIDTGSDLQHGGDMWRVLSSRSYSDGPKRAAVHNSQQGYSFRYSCRFTRGTI